MSSAALLGSPHIPEPGISYVTMIGEVAPSTLTVGGLLREAAAEVPDRVALMEPTGDDGVPGRRWTYAELLAEAERGAHALLTRLSPGQHLTVWAGNSPEWVIVQFSAALAGVVLVTANPGLRRSEIAYAITQADSVGVIYNRRYRDVDAESIVKELADELPDLGFTLAIEDWPRFTAATGAAPGAALPDGDGSRPSMIQYTSGTTGQPKAAVLPDRSIVNCGRFASLTLALPTAPTWYMASPLFHTGGCVFGVLGTVWQRGTLVIPAEFDAARMLDSVARDGVNGATLVPTMCLRLLESYAERPVNIGNLDVIVGGGASVPPALVRRLEDELGCEFMMVFGQTETGSAVSMSTRGDTMAHRTETVGRLFPNLEARIVDVVDGRTLPWGEQGEIVLRGYMSFAGYLGMPDETAKTLDADGWLHTGDLGTLTDDGYLSITGRLKNMIIRGGEKVFPREIENVLGTHPDIAQVAVFGIPDPRWGEVAVADVIPRAGAEPDAASLKDWLRERIARYKVPEHVRITNSFPTTPTGKVQTFIMRDDAIKELGRPDEEQR